MIQHMVDYSIESTFRGLSAESMDPVDKPRGGGAEINRYQSLTFFLVSFLFISISHALPSDRTALIHLTANSISLDQHHHHGLYQGEVTLDQGSSHLRADKVITENNEKNQLTKAIAYGNKQAQAHVWTLTSEDKPEIHAYADQLTYDPALHQITLIGHATVTQGSHSFSAPFIKYNTITEHITTQQDGAMRTTIIIDPKSLS